MRKNKRKMKLNEYNSLFYKDFYHRSEEFHLSVNLLVAI